jgi:ribosomal protein L35AE/L33A
VSTLAGEDQRDLFGKTFSMQQSATGRSFSEMVTNILGVENQDAASKYVGKYKCYRLSNNEGSLITGEITIEKIDLHHFVFRHTSKQRLSRSRVADDFNHHGSFVVLSNRIYFVGLGADHQGSYLRPIIANAVDSPQDQIIVGILLTETADLIPMACKTVIVHMNCETKLRQNYQTQDAFDTHIGSLLVNESKLGGVLSGWSRKPLSSLAS